MASIEQVDVKSLKVVELKEELSKRGLETTGLKKDVRIAHSGLETARLAHAFLSYTEYTQLADRLQKAQDLALSGGTELAAPGDVTKDEALPPKEIIAAQSTSAEAEPKQSKEDGVGHTMVEGAPEASEEIEEKVDAATENAKEEVPQPAIFDEEVAEVIRREEIKEQMPTSPSPPRAISPRPVSPAKNADANGHGQEDAEMKGRPSNIETPPMPTGDLPAQDSHNTKRTRDDEMSVPAKRQKKIYDTPLPSSLSHLLHPPTSTLYITNLRRPMLLSTLHDYVSPSSSSLLPPPRHPFASEDAPGLWLSGVKDHAYAAYPTIDAALEVAGRIEGVMWPEDTGAKLHVEFVPDEKVAELVEKEEAAWSNGRQKLSLQVQREGDEWSFTFKGEGAIGPRAGEGRGIQTRPVSGRAAPGSGVDAGAGIPIPGGFGRRAPPSGSSLSGANAVRPPPGAPTGPSGGRGGYGVPPHMGRQGGGGRFGREPPVSGRFAHGGGPSGRAGFGGRGGRSEGGMKRTNVKPSLPWREGPGGQRR